MRIRAGLHDGNCILLQCILSIFIFFTFLTSVTALHSTDTITSGGDNTRSGYQTNHNMDPTIVGSPQFGILWRKKLLGNYRGWTEQIFAQPLVYTPSGGDKQYVYIASQMNWVYKIDAKTGDIVASRNLHVPFLVSDLDGCNDISYCIGSTATGVIDPATNTWYLTTKTYRDQTDVEKGRLNGRYYIHALSTDDLTERPNFPISLEGLIASNNDEKMFQSGNHHQRPALMQTGSYIYAGFASHCVQYNFTGWIIGWHATAGNIVEAFATEGGPEGKKGGGVWMSGGGLAQDGPNRMFFATGNGYASQLHGIPVPGRQPPTALEEAVVHMSIQPDGKLQPVDFFMPWEKTQLDAADKDLGTSGFALLDPTTFTSPSVKRIGCVAGKSGKLYFLNLDDLGGYSMGPNKLDAALQVTQLDNSVFSTAGSYPLEGGYVYVNPVRFPTVVFKYGVSVNTGLPEFTKVAETDEASAYVLGVGHGTTTSLNGKPGTGIYWLTDIQGLHLRAYKAVPENGKMVRILGLNIPGTTKFTRPVFGDGRLYITTTQGALVAVGSPVNLPLECASPVDFGTATINGNSTSREISCKAKVAVEISGISPIGGLDWKVSNLPAAFPFSLAKDMNITFTATFAPTSPGPLSDAIYINSTSAVAGYSGNTPISVRGVATSEAPLLQITPNTIAFPGIILGDVPGGLNETFVFMNRGIGKMIVSEVLISTAGESGPWTTVIGSTASAGPLHFYNIPSEINGESETRVTVNFNPTEEGGFPAYIKVTTNGGTSLITVVSSAGLAPTALIEFEKADGSGWIPYTNMTTFDFGPVTQSTTKHLKLRLSNTGNENSAALQLTISKPPIGAGFLIAASNNIDLGEGTRILGGKYEEATIYCSVPRSQPNVDPYVATATWTMNSNDPSMGKVEIPFRCDAVSQQRGPLKTNGQAKYRYVGCFKENNPGRQLEKQTYSNLQNENGKCTQACADLPQNYIFAGSQYHRECWCGNKIPTLRVNDNDCNFACSADDNQYCGGNGYFGGGSYISLFADDSRFDPNGTIPNPSSTSTTSGTNPTSVAPTPTVAPGGPYHNPGNGEWSLMGCYTEPSGKRALEKPFYDDALTASKCWNYCKAYNYAGMEYGRECWCGNTLAEASLKVELKECSTLCKGNSSEYCGKGSRLDLYTKLPLSSSVGASSMPGVSSGPTSTASSTSTEISLSSAVSSAASTTVPASSSVTPTSGDPSSPAPPTSAPTESSSASVSSSAVASSPSSSWPPISSPESSTPPTSSPEPFPSPSESSSALPSPSESSSAFPSPSESSSAFPSPSESSSAFPSPSESSSASPSSLPPVSSAESSSSQQSPSASPTSSGGAGSDGSTSTSTTLPSATSDPWVHLGCANETTPRALTGGSISGSMTVQKCQNFCLSLSLPLSGVEYGNECYCGTALQAGSMLNQTGCNKPCTGDASQICGGSSRLNIYNYTLFVPPSTPPSIGLFVNQGCWSEGTGERTLKGYSFSNSTSMTAEMCVEECGKKGWSYAGVEYAQECYCSNAISDTAVKIEDSKCDMLCRGNIREYCGGSRALNVYKYEPEQFTSSGLVAGVINVDEKRRRVRRRGEQKKKGSRRTWA